MTKACSGRIRQFLKTNGKFSSFQDTWNDGDEWRYDKWLMANATWDCRLRWDTFTTGRGASLERSSCFEFWPVSGFISVSDSPPLQVVCMEFSVKWRWIKNCVDLILKLDQGLTVRGTVRVTVIRQLCHCFMQVYLRVVFNIFARKWLSNIICTPKQTYLLCKQSGLNSQSLLPVIRENSFDTLFQEHTGKRTYIYSSYILFSKLLGTKMSAQSNQRYATTQNHSLKFYSSKDSLQGRVIEISLTPLNTIALVQLAPSPTRAPMMGGPVRNAIELKA